ncbi:MAG: hypothetical protein M1838_001862 [Thelocarpon superellum]|nr:MAG: hypothetical protein M1838_001862 [Thelocarpon superellum]
MAVGVGARPASKVKPWVETPLKLSAPLSRSAGCKVYMKLDNLQPSGSFKTRGIGHYMSQRILEHGPEAKVHFYCASGGNAGLACATAAQTLGRQATIVVLESTPAHVVAKIRLLGATVHQHGASWQDADGYLRAQCLAPDPDGVYVPAFDHEDIWVGNASCVNEIAAQLRILKASELDERTDAAEADWDGRPDAIICSVGGGGLLNGVMLALDAHGWGSSVPVLAVETRGADSLAQAVAAGQLVTLPAITSIAKSLGAVRVAAQTLASAQRANVRTVVVEDAQAARASWRFADDERILVEVGCSASLTPLYEPGLLKQLVPGLHENSRVVVVVCGGSNISLEILEGYRRTYGAGEVTVADVPSAFTAPTASRPAETRRWWFPWIRALRG